MRTHTLYGIAAMLLAIQALCTGEVVFGFFSALFGIVAFVLYVVDAR